MTYFNYKHKRGTRGEAVYQGSTLLGRVAIKGDWRSRFTLSLTSVDLYSAIGLGGDTLPGLFRSRHDAAEALYAMTSAASGEDEGTATQRG